MISVIISEYKNISGRDKVNMFKILYNWLFNPNFRVGVWIAYLQKVKTPLLKKLIQNHLEVKYSVLISINCKIGRSFKLEHFFGVVIGRDVVIGDNCKIYQQVTLGQKDGKFPVIGDNVEIYPGAKIIGGVRIGNNVQIGTNAVVIQDIPDNSTAVGVPARIIK